MGVKIDPVVPDRTDTGAGVRRFAERRKKGLSVRWNFLGERLSGRARERFYHDLSELLRAGMDTRNALGTMAEAHGGSPIGAAATGLCERLVEGASLHAAMQEQRTFSALEAFSIRIGEESGDLAGIATELHGHYAQLNRLKRKIVAAISYPAFVTVISFGVITFMLAIVVPMFADVFKRFGKDLPPLTKAVVAASHHGGLIVILLLAVIVVGVIIGVLRRRFPSVDLATVRVLYRLPFIGPLVKEGHTARTCQAMAMLLAADVPLTEALALAADMSGSSLFRNGLRTSGSAVVRGVPLHEALKDTRLFDTSSIALIKVGEEVNRLDRMFLRMADRARSALEQRATVMTSILEPTLILLVAVFVGIVLVAMYLPLFRLGSMLD